MARPQYSMDPKDFPFYNMKLGIAESKFTAVIHSTTSVIRESSPLCRLIKNVGQSKFIAKVNINCIMFLMALRHIPCVVSCETVSF